MGCQRKDGLYRDVIYDIDIEYHIQSQVVFKREDFSL